MTTTAITFIVPGPPVPWARARLGAGRHYTDPRVAAYKRLVAQMAAMYMRGTEPFGGPVALSLVAGMPIPESWPKARREAAQLGQIAPGSKPDWDNIGKGISDALNGIVYRDDAQIVQASVEKRYSASPSVVVTVTALGGQQA